MSSNTIMFFIALLAPSKVNVIRSTDNFVGYNEFIFMNIRAFDFFYFTWMFVALFLVLTCYKIISSNVTDVFQGLKYLIIHRRKKKLSEQEKTKGG